MNKNVLSDLDGVIYRGKELIPGAKEFVERLRKNGNRFLFLTNNSEQTAGDLRKKLEVMGIDGLLDANFVTSAMATALFLDSQKKRGTAFVVGGNGLVNELCRIGYSITEDSPDYVVVGKTKEFNFEMLQKAIEFIGRGSRFIATNPDVLDPVEGGFEPAAGSLLAPIEKATGKPPFIVGKPNAIMMTIARKILGAHSEDTIMIGDRMDTDILGGLESGMKTCLVLSGVSTEKTVEQFSYRPDYIFNHVGEIYPDTL